VADVLILTVRQEISSASWLTAGMAIVRPEISLVSGDFWGAVPHDGLAWLRHNDPVHWDEAGRVWGITRYDDVKAVSAQPEVFSSAGGIRPDTGPIPMMIDMDDPEHLRRRRLVNKGFTPKRVAALRDRIREVVDGLVDRVCQQGTCDLVTDIAAWLPLVMIGDALGVEPEDHPTLLKWSDDLMRGQGQSDEALVLAMIGAFEGYNTYIREVIADRGRCPRDDLMSVLVHAELDGDRLDEDALVHESLLILIGGDETTRHVISGGVYQLLAEPSRWDRVRADRSLLPAAVEESLRWVSPIKNMCRTATRDVELGDKTIHEGDKLLLLYPSANRDEDHFADPFTFDLNRSPNDHVAFGFGAHFCLGASLARLELTVAFETLLDRLPDLHLAGDGEPANRPANFVSGYESLPVAFTPTTRVAG
jgi:cytochrome P450 family 142 subfamily A polypeptide 1